jgi:hypothetical protein
MPDFVLSAEMSKVALEVDGSLRDIYVLETTLDDWRSALAMLIEAPYDAILDGSPLPSVLPDLRALFFAPGRPRSILSFRVGRVQMACHFFGEQEIEFDFDPRGLVATDLRGVLDFMERLGVRTGKPVMLTPENVRKCPIFRFDPRNGLIEYQLR